jgi:hypothetical protein
MELITDNNQLANAAIDSIQESKGVSFILDKIDTNLIISYLEKKGHEIDCNIDDIETIDLINEIQKRNVNPLANLCNFFESQLEQDTFIYLLNVSKKYELYDIEKILPV